MKELHNQVLVMHVSETAIPQWESLFLKMLIQINSVGISKSLAKKKKKRFENKMVNWQLCWYI